MNFIQKEDIKKIITVVIIICIIVAIIILSYSLVKNNTGDDRYFTVKIILICIVLFLIFISTYQYFTGISVTSSLENVNTQHPELDIDIYKNPQPPISSLNQTNEEKPIPIPFFSNKPQVFNIPENIYNYQDAKAVCQAFNSKLATYDQLEDYYKDGGEFCNYGWSDGQMALFPTQKKTFNNLQTIEGHEHDCGRPGINGGYISNPLVRFGANCYGMKPTMTPKEQEIMETVPNYPQTKKDMEFEEKVDYWKDKMQDIIISPFNKNKWDK